MTLDRSILPFWKSAILSILIWMPAIFFSVFFFTVGLVFVLPVSFFRDHGTRYLLHRVAVRWASCIIKVNPLWRLKIEGWENVQPGKPYVIVANHQSLLDILVLLSGMPPRSHFKFLAKRELFPIPFFGWHMVLAKYIPLDRSSHESGKKVMLIARQWLRKGVSVAFYPEGTRSLDGEIHAFKVGAFKLAQEENLQILPVVIDGTGEAVPKKSWRLKQVVDLLISFGPPVSLTKSSAKTIEQMRDQVRAEMIDRLAHFRAQRRGQKGEAANA